jgi:uncharacterized protein
MAAGMKTRSFLEVGATGVRLPVLLVRGDVQGPALVVSAGVHGDEFEGVRAIYELFEELRPEEMSGSWIGVPVVNPPAHQACSRLSSLDGQNLARVFPGKPDGTVSEQIAWTFDQKVLSQASFYLDLHSGGTRYAMPSMVGFDANDVRGTAAAAIFGAPVTWAHPVIEPGRTISAARDRGIPFLYTEAWGAARIAGEDLVMMKRGVRNLLRHLGVLSDGALEATSPPLRLYGVGNTDGGLQSTQAGFLMKDVNLLDRVKKGQRIGHLVNSLGETLEEYFAPCDSIIGLTREMPVVDVGDTLFLFAAAVAENENG